MRKSGILFYNQGTPSWVSSGKDWAIEIDYERKQDRGGQWCVLKRLFHLSFFFLLFLFSPLFLTVKVEKNILMKAVWHTTYQIINFFDRMKFDTKRMKKNRSNWRIPPAVSFHYWSFQSVEKNFMSLFKS